jgi:hypothetical protein
MPPLPGVSLVIPFMLATIKRSAFFIQPANAHWTDPLETQWLIEDAGNGLYYMKNWKGVYLTYSTTPQSGVPITCTAAKSAFRIIEDSVDASCLKSVTVLSLSILLYLLCFQGLAPHTGPGHGPEWLVCCSWNSYCSLSDSSWSQSGLDFRVNYWSATEI